jgi:hypothetical protein
VRDGICVERHHLKQDKGILESGKQNTNGPFNYGIWVGNKFVKSGDREACYKVIY